MSGIMDRINKIKKLSEGEKQEIKQMCKSHASTIHEYMKNNELPYVVRIALEDRLCVLNNTYLKI